MRAPMTLLAGAAAALVLASPAHGGPSAAISAKPRLQPRFAPGVSDYASRCRLGHPLRITVRGRTRRYRLRAGQAVTVRANGRTYHVRCIPAEFPHWSAERHGNPQAKWYLVTPTLGPHGSHVVAIFDRSGAPVWWMERPTKPHDAKLLPDGNLAWSTFTNGQFASHSVPYEEHRLDGTLVRRIAAVGAPTDGHDLQVLPNGDYLTLSYVPRDGVDLSAYGGGKNATVIDAEVQEVTPKGKRVWRWNSKDHIAVGESAPFMKSIVSGPVKTADGRLAHDLVHVNSVEPDGDSVLISMRQTDSVYKVSRRTGAVEWKLGGTHTAQSLALTNVADPANVMTGQHDARLLPDGTLTVHDNRTLSGERPRAIRFRIDEAARSATLIEAIADPAAAYSNCCGSARRLPGGNWVMSWGASGLVTELSPSGRRLYGLRFGGHTGADSYRAIPIMPGQLSIRALRAGMDAMARRSSRRR
jgi:hypothetical protein